MLNIIRKLFSQGNSMVGSIILVIICIIVVFAPLLTPYDPIDQNLADSLQSPSLKHPFGTDLHGRDILSRTLYGSRISMLVGFASIVLGISIGGILGLLSGYLGSVTDLLIQRVVDVLMSFPSLILALLLSATLGGGLWAVIVAIGTYNISRFARLIRAQVITVKEENYVEAAQALGASALRIVIRHITPNILMPVIILGTLRLGAAILIEASLSYLGFGIQPPTPTWGAIVADGKSFLLVAPWISLFPGIAIMLVVIGFNLLGDGLRDIFDPRLKGT